MGEGFIFLMLSRILGALAQLGERLHGMEEVESSILLRSTKRKQINLRKGDFFVLIGCCYN